MTVAPSHPGELRWRFCAFAELSVHELQAINSARQYHATCVRTATRRAVIPNLRLSGLKRSIPCPHGITASCSRPAFSGRPNMMFMFCTAWPEAPFTRLSITDSTTAVSPPSG